MPSVRAAALVLLSTTALEPMAYGKAGIQAGLYLAAGYNTNPLAAAVDTPDAFADVRPQLILSIANPRVAQRLSYTFAAVLYHDHLDLDTYSNALDYAAVVEPSKTTLLLLNAGLSQGQTSFLGTQQGSATTPIVIQSPGSTQFVSARFGESLSWDFHPRWRFLENTSLNAFIPLSSTLPSTEDLTEGFGVQRAWAHDAGIAEIAADYILYPEVRGSVTRPDGTIDPNGTLVPWRQQLLGSFDLRWKHDLGRYFSSELSAGVLFGGRPDDWAGGFIQPTALAALHYIREEGAVDLSYSHTVQANALIAQTFAIDQVVLRGALPLGRKTHLTVAASGGYQHGRTLDGLTGALTSTIDVWLADATLTWTPYPVLSIFARYQYTDQIGNPNDLTPLPTFMRHVALAGVSVLYPAEPIVAVRAREPLRADSGDRPRIPEPHSEAPAPRP